MSGVGSLGEVSVVSEFPVEPTYIVPPPRPRSQNEVITPAFSVRIGEQPEEVELAGIGEDIYEQRVEIQVEGFVTDLAQHLAFSTLLRNYFRKNTRIPLFDWEGNQVTPELIDYTNNYVDRRLVEAVELPNVPDPVKYYISMIFDLVYYD